MCEQSFHELLKLPSPGAIPRFTRAFFALAARRAIDLCSNPRALNLAVQWLRSFLLNLVKAALSAISVLWSWPGCARTLLHTAVRANRPVRYCMLELIVWEVECKCYVCNGNEIRLAVTGLIYLKTSPGPNSLVLLVRLHSSTTTPSMMILSEAVASPNDM